LAEKRQAEDKMLMEAFFAIATFTAPEQIGTNPQSMLWLLPLAAAIAVVYKATKLPTITAGNFIKEALLLLGSIVVFIIITAVALCTLAWLITK
jgi:hypothetical protein